MKSIPEFLSTYFNSNFGKSAQKLPPELSKRSHKVVLINVFDNSNGKLVGKMNFVDLAGSFCSINFKFFYNINLL